MERSCVTASGMAFILAWCVAMNLALIGLHAYKLAICQHYTPTTTIIEIVFKTNALIVRLLFKSVVCPISLQG